MNQRTRRDLPVGVVWARTIGVLGCSVVLGSACALGCSAAGSEHDAGALLEEAGSALDAANHEPDAAAPDAGLAIDPGCVAPEGIATSPRTIADVVALLNALPKPVTLPCFVQALARPLVLNATDSQLSAQPALGKRSPRTFLFFAGVTLSVVPDGMGKRLLELGEARPDNQSLKAELEFPIEQPLDEGAPYVRLPFNESITNCGFCHQGEVHDDTIAAPAAFVSPALRPRPFQRVPLEMLRAEYAACDTVAEPDRCALLRALFAQKPEPLEHEFPESYKTFF